MNKPHFQWITPVSGPSVLGDRRNAILFGTDHRLLLVYNPSVIPHVLTAGPQNSFPDPFSLHISGKRTKVAIQTASWHVK